MLDGLLHRTSPHRCQRSQVLRALRIPDQPCSHGSGLDNLRCQVPIQDSERPHILTAPCVQTRYHRWSTHTFDGPLASRAVACTNIHSTDTWIMAGDHGWSASINFYILGTNRFHPPSRIQHLQRQAIHTSTLLNHSQRLQGRAPHNRRRTNALDEEYCHLCNGRARKPRQKYPRHPRSTNLRKYNTRLNCRQKILQNNRVIVTNYSNRPIQRNE